MRFAAPYRLAAASPGVPSIWRHQFIVSRLLQNSTGITDLADDDGRGNAMSPTKMLVCAVLLTLFAGTHATFAQPGSAQSLDWVRMPNGTRYVRCTERGCHDGIILDRPNADICEGLGIREYQRQRFFCYR